MNHSLNVLASLRSYLITLINIMSSKVPLALGLMVCLSLTEGISLLMLIPLLQLVGLDIQQGNLGHLAQFVPSFFLAIGIRITLITVLGIYVFIVIMHSLLKRWEGTVSLTLQYEFVDRLRQRLYRAISNTNWLFFVRNRSSDFTHALTIEMERVGAATYYLLNLFATAIVALVYILLALKISALTTGLVFLCGGALMLLLKGKAKIAHITGEGLSEAMESLYAAVTEQLSGMKTAKSYGAEDRHADIFNKLTEKVRSMYTRTVENQAEVNYWFNIGSVLILSFILYVSFQILSMPTAGVLLLLYLFARIMPKFSSIQQSFQSIINLLPSFTNITEMQQRCEKAAEPKTDRMEKFNLQYGIRFEGVTFSYDDQSITPVIRNLHFVIKSGETTAIVGPSGTGKTTVADLLMGLIVPNLGRIIVDDKELCPEHIKS